MGGDMRFFGAPKGSTEAARMQASGSFSHRERGKTSGTSDKVVRRRFSSPGGRDVRSILETCKPRTDILGGTFNPEIFTASLSQVLDFYRGKNTVIHNLYTDAQQFFTQATYPTDGLRRVLYEVFGRLAGDNAMPAIHRLETGF